MRPAALVGLDIAAGEIRAVVVPRRGAPRSHRTELPAGAVVAGEIRDGAAVTVALRQLWSSANIHTRSVVIGLNNHDVVTRPVDVPDLGDDDIRSTLRYELTDMIPFPVADSHVDFVPIGESTDPRGVRQRRVLAVAALRDTVRACADAVRAAGLKVVAVDASSFALVRAACATGTAGATGAIIDIGTDQVTIVVHEQGRVRFTRTVVTQQDNALSGEIEAELVLLDRFRRRAAGAEDLVVDEDQWDPVADAVRGTIEYAVTDDLSVASLVVTGDPERGATIAPQLERMLSVPVALADPIADAGHDPSVASIGGGTAFALAYGLALAGDDGDAGPRRLDLSTTDDPGADRRSLAKTAAVVAAATAVVVGGGAFLFGPSTSDLDEQVAAAATRVAALDSRAESHADATVDASERLVRRARAETVATQGIDWATLLATLTERTPAGTTVLAVKGGGPTTTAEGEVPGHIEIVVQAPSQAAVASWIAVLDSIDGLSQPWLTDASSRDGGDATFTVSARLDEAGPVKVGQ